MQRDIDFMRKDLNTAVLDGFASLFQQNTKSTHVRGWGSHAGAAGAARTRLCVRARVRGCAHAPPEHPYHLAAPPPKTHPPQWVHRGFLRAYLSVRSSVLALAENVLHGACWAGAGHLAGGLHAITTHGAACRGAHTPPQNPPLHPPVRPPASARPPTRRGGVVGRVCDWALVGRGAEHAVHLRPRRAQVGGPRHQAPPHRLLHLWPAARRQPPLCRDCEWVAGVCGRGVGGVGGTCAGVEGSGPAPLLLLRAPPRPEQNCTALLPRTAQLYELVPNYWRVVNAKDLVPCVPGLMGFW